MDYGLHVKLSKAERAFELFTEWFGPKFNIIRVTKFLSK